jgi:hypothetical protein
MLFFWHFKPFTTEANKHQVILVSICVQPNYQKRTETLRRQQIGYFNEEYANVRCYKVLSSVVLCLAFLRFVNIAVMCLTLPSSWCAAQFSGAQCRLSCNFGIRTWPCCDVLSRCVRLFFGVLCCAVPGFGLLLWTVLYCTLLSLIMMCWTAV